MSRAGYTGAIFLALASLVSARVGERPSYGYRRVTALLKRELAERVNPKPIYRIMKRNKLLRERCTGDGRGRKHDGKIITLKPNLLWCSDSFEIRCWSGERVHVAFVLDSCDREVTGFVAAPGPLCGEHVRDMMVEAVESGPGAKMSGSHRYAPPAARRTLLISTSRRIHITYSRPPDEPYEQTKSSNSNRERGYPLHETR
jgi:transposase InsO family protein